MTIEGLWLSATFFFGVRDLPSGMGSFCKADGPRVGRWLRLGLPVSSVSRNRGWVVGFALPGVPGCMRNQDAVEAGCAGKHGVCKSAPWTPLSQPRGATWCSVRHMLGASVEKPEWPGGNSERVTWVWGLCPHRLASGPSKGQRVWRVWAQGKGGIFEYERPPAQRQDSPAQLVSAGFPSLFVLLTMPMAPGGSCGDLLKPQRVLEAPFVLSP